MKKLIGFLMLISAIMMLSGSTTAYADKIKVVATIAEVADFARNVGGDKVEVTAIFNGQCDVHFFEPVPSHVVRLRSADILIVGGLDVDEWARGLIDASRNPRIRFGSPGYIDPSDGVKAISVPVGRIDGSMGDVHPHGNPHYWYTPENVEIAVRNICEGFSRFDPDNREYYETNAERYISEVHEVFDELKKVLEPYKGAKIMQYHESWDYFASTFGLEIVATVEPKPGISPTASHLSQLVSAAKRHNKVILLAEPYYPSRPINFLVRNGGIKALRLHVHIGASRAGDTYLENLRMNVTEIAKALK